VSKKNYVLCAIMATEPQKPAPASQEKFLSKNKSQPLPPESVTGNTKLTAIPAVADEARPAIKLPEGDRGFLTTSELQKTVLPLSRRSIFEWRKKGIIPSIQIGSKVLYHAASVERALLARQNGGADQ